jgi:hypothetical protein
MAGSETCKYRNWSRVTRVDTPQQVAVYLAGHDHGGGFACTAAGVPHITVAGIATQFLAAAQSLRPY